MTSSRSIHYPTSPSCIFGSSRPPDRGAETEQSPSSCQNINNIDPSNYHFNHIRHSIPHSTQRLNSHCQTIAGTSVSSSTSSQTSKMFKKEQVVPIFPLICIKFHQQTRSLQLTAKQHFPWIEIQSEVLRAACNSKPDHNYLPTPGTAYR